MDTKRILVIEDDEEIIELIEINVEHLDYELDTAVDGEKGLKMAKSGHYDLIILDLMLPKLDGMEICKRLRSKNDNTPILMLTAKSEEFDKVLGLELGADDYLTKPFGIRELLARIKANMRRVEVDKQENARDTTTDDLTIGELSIEPDKHKVTISGKSVSVTPKEFELLHLFAANPEKSFSRKELLEQVLVYQFEEYDHTVNSHINRLRNKIEKDPSDPTYLKTVWGVGYRFVEPEEIE